MLMPEANGRIIGRRSEIAAAMRRIVPGHNVVDHTDELRVYESDALMAYKQSPLLVVLPETAQQVADILRWCQAEGVNVVPRGAGTSLSGGALPVADGILLGLGKFNRILEIDPDNRVAVLQPGVTNAAISEAVAGLGLFYAPDPSSQIACTIGGNVAENAGGVHCLKYGLTSHNVTGIELVTMDGEILRIGGKTLDTEGYDLLGLIVGSEGLLGVVTEVTVRLLPQPQGHIAMLIGFASVDDAGHCVADIIAAGVIPAGLEMMDKAAIHAAEEFLHIGYPLDAEALLIVEVDGPPAECDYLAGIITALAHQSHATTIRQSHTEHERLGIWAGRKAAFPAVGRISPDYYCVDGTIPRRCLPDMLRQMRVLSAKYGLRVVNVFHAGDGNLHPLILYDAEVAGQIDKAVDFGADILKLCVEMGGVLTGEHGVGVEKRDLMPSMFTEADLDQQRAVKCVLDPEGRLNPGKVFPTLRRCCEQGRVHVHRGQVPFPEIPRF
jgi:glycolate oxidase